MNILNICNNADVLSVMRIVKIVITCIRIIVPIVLLLSLMLGYLSAVKDDDMDALDKVNRGMPAKVIAALLVFFIPTFVNLIADILDVNKNSYISCIKMANKESINEALYQTALEKVHRARETLSKSDYSAAVSAVNKIKEHEFKYGLENQLAEIAEYISIIDQINELKIKYDRGKYKELEDKISKINDVTVKEKLTKMLESVSVGKPLDVTPGFYLKQTRSFQYHLIIPPNPMTNMPLIIFLHGDGGFKETGVTGWVRDGSGYKFEEYFYLAPHPNGYTKGMKWDNKSVIEGVKSIIDSIVKTYEIDQDRIIITGYSYGAIGVWDTSNAYPNFFSAAVPISCGGGAYNAKNYKNTAVWAISGDKDDELIYGPKMEARVKNINAHGGNAKYTKLKGKGHTDMGGTFKKDEVISWALDQRRGKK